MDVKDGHIAACKILGDFFCNAGEGIQELEQRLIGASREPEQLEHVLAQADLSRYFSNCEPSVMARFFAQAPKTDLRRAGVINNLVIFQACCVRGVRSRSAQGVLIIISHFLCPLFVDGILCA